MIAEKVNRCRSCGSEELRDVLELGATPVANALVPLGAGDGDPTYPLAVSFCVSCSLVQLAYSLPADAFFNDDYPYYSSFSSEICRHSAEHVANLIERRELGPAAFVIEVASNDGYLLRNFAAAGVRVLGIDPSSGPAAAAQAADVPTIVGFFGVATAEEIRDQHGLASVIIANNVMAHVPDLNDFVAGFAVLLADDGVLTIENPYVRDMVDSCAFDTIYHEHYCYFSCSAVDALMRRHGLHLNDVEYFPNLHGGTLRWWVEREPRRSTRCQAYLDREIADGLTSLGFYSTLAPRVRDCQTSLHALLDELHSQHRSVVAYGAAAKGATLLNCTGIETSRITYVVDRNVHKHNKLMPGCRLPIHPVERLLEDQPDFVVLLAWNFASEIISQQADYLERGGHFIMPVPIAKVL